MSAWRSTGRMLGEIGLLSAEPHDVTALALTDVVTLTFKRETFMPLREEQPRLWGRLVAQRSGSQAFECAALRLAGCR